MQITSTMNTSNYKLDWQFNGETIELNGIRYPFTEVHVDDVEVPYDIIVSTKALEKELLDDNYCPISKSAQYLDELIGFYVETEDMLNLPNKELLYLIYD